MKRRMVREAYTSLPWLGIGAHGWGSGYVWPDSPRALGMCLARDMFAPAGSTLTNNATGTRWARLQGGGVVELPPGVPVTIGEPIVGVSDEPLWQRRDLRDAVEAAAAAGGGVVQLPREVQL